MNQSEDQPNPDGAKEKPHCVAIVICNEVIEDKKTNNKTLVSLFNTTVVEQLPSVQHRFSIVASLTSGIGVWPLVFRITNPSGVEILRLDGQVEFQDPLAVLDFVVEVRSLPLEREGIYLVDVLAGTTPIAERRFRVQMAQQET